MSILTFMGITPLVGALLVLLVPSKNTELIKRVALLISLVVAVISILVAIRFEKICTRIPLTKPPLCVLVKA